MKFSMKKFQMQTIWEEFYLQLISSIEGNFLLNGEKIKFWKLIEFFWVRKISSPNSPQFIEDYPMKF